MTFEQQTTGIPLALVQQGWRRAPQPTTHDAWLREYGRWQWSTLWHSDIRIARPVTVFSDHASADIVVYDHAGWGEGLAPTADAVKIWFFWWRRTTDGPKVVRITEDARGLWARTFDSVQIHVSVAEWDWLGPVLPPVTP